jgi:NAD(P)-dependent dehydrogenase (short-subunit alcohol dehydrogenase family)
MRVLALRGAHVLAVARTKEKAVAAFATVANGLMETITPLGCEQSDFSSVVACADAVQALGRPLDMLVCNAGIAKIITLELTHGLEKQFVVNHLSHFILVNRLLNLVKAAPQGRIVMVSSNAHWRAPAVGIDFDGLSAIEEPRPMYAYGRSKLANVLMTRELARRLKETSATANAIHPGVVATNIFQNLPRPIRSILNSAGKFFMKDLETGAATMCYVATNPALESVSGRYFNNCKPEKPSPQAQDDILAARLWSVSEDLTKAYLR